MKFKLIIVMLCSLLISGFTFAHHSFAPYDIRNPIEISGVAEDFVYRRPHPMLTLIDDENVEWIIEVPFRFWNRAGIPEDAIVAGDELIARIWPHRTGIPEAALSGFTKEGVYYDVHEEVGQRSGNEAANAIAAGESVESVLERFADE